MAHLNKPVIMNCAAFDDRSGGSIVFHYLTHRLRKMGIEAYTFPLIKESHSNRSPWLKDLHHEVIKRKHAWGLRPYTSHPSLDAPMAPLSALRRGIGVYPEIVSGNPLNCAHVARWILYTPGGHGQGESFATPVPGEEVFFFQELFVKDIAWIPRENWLRLQWFRDDLFNDPGQTERTAICRMIRKGTSTADNAPAGAENAIILDGKSNEAIADIFKMSRFFYCHDPYTMYCDYAVMCGCLPIVIPKPGVSRTQWRPKSDRYGIAYGDSPEQLDWARRTRSGLLKRIADLKQQEDKLLEHFVERLASSFR